MFLTSLVYGQVSSNVTFRGQLPYANDLNDIWGWRNPADGKEYALVGVTNGFSIVDVSNPASPSQVQFVSGAFSTWRDVKTWGNYAYVVNESSGGLLIVDMTNLPGSITTTTWTGGIGYSTSHNIFIDENGVAYLCGSNGSLGTLMLNVNANPTNPPVLGSYTTRYVHDLFVRGDTMWTAEINNGIFSVVNVTNKAAPVVLATQSTSSNFTHNLWLSDNGQFLYTTDEVSGANVDAYDVSDLSDIQEVDRFRPGTTTNSIPHNTFVKGNFLVTAWYRDGMRITDATFPENLIEVGWYDSSPFSGNGFNGAWCVYPYLPSGNALISDIEEGLVVVTPSYAGAAFLQGIVTDQVSGAPLLNATVTISGTTASDITNLFGQYSTGIAIPGTYSITVSRAGYLPKTVAGVVLTAGSIAIQNVTLVPSTAFTLSGQVKDAETGNGIPSASLRFESLTGTVEVTTNAFGNFTLAGFSSGNYDIFAGKWGYETSFQTGIGLNPGTGSLVINLNPGYADDFSLPLGWTVSSTASSGIWARGEPIGTIFEAVEANPDLDLPSDFGNQCYVTGNGGGAAGTDDVDNGRTTLRSPIFNLSTNLDPQLEYARWFFNAGGDGFPNDSLIIKLSNGTTTATLEIVTAATPGNSSWITRSFRVLDYLPLTANMQLIVTTADVGVQHLVEAGLDGFKVTDTGVATCDPPTNTTTSNITSNSARVNWDPVAGALGYQVSGRKVGTTNFRNSTTGSTFRNVSGLNAATAYEWKVRVQCTSGLISDFTPLTTFTTLTLRVEDETASIQLQPNPASTTTQLILQIPADGAVQLNVYDIQGKQRLSDQFSGAKGTFQHTLDVSSLSPGVYWVVLAGKDWQIQTELIRMD